MLRSLSSFAIGMVALAGVVLGSTPPVLANGSSASQSLPESPSASELPVSCGVHPHGPSQAALASAGSRVTLPANVPALSFWIENVDAVQSIALKSITRSGAIVATTLERNAGESVLRLGASLTPGDEYVVEVTSKCGGGEGESGPLKTAFAAEFKAGAAAKLPTSFGALVQGDELLGETSRPKSMPVLGANLPNEARAFLLVTRFEMVIPELSSSRVMSSYGGEPGNIWSTAGSPTKLGDLFAFCEKTGPVRVNAYLAGSSEPYATELISIDIADWCATRGSSNGTTDPSSTSASGGPDGMGVGADNQPTDTRLPTSSAAQADERRGYGGEDLRQEQARTLLWDNGSEAASCAMARAGDRNRAVGFSAAGVVAIAVGLLRARRRREWSTK